MTEGWTIPDYNIRESKRARRMTIKVSSWTGLEVVVPVGFNQKHIAEFVQSNMSKPVAAFIAGQHAPPGKRMGHAGAIITGESARAESKVAALRDAGAVIIPTPANIGSTAKTVFDALH